MVILLTWQSHDNISLPLLHCGKEVVPIHLKSFTTTLLSDHQKNKTYYWPTLTIITNIFYFISYFPEFLSTILTIVYSKGISYMNFNFSANLINEIFEVFGIVSILSNFYIFLIFNKNFHVSFLEVKNNFFERFKKKTL